MAADADVVVVPLRLTIAGRSFRDDEVPLSELLAADSWTTSGPTPGDFAEAIAAADEGDGVLVVTVAREMSATYTAALVAADAFPVGAVRVLDSRTAAGAEGLVALAAARRAATGGDLDAVTAAAAEAAGAACLIATLPDLTRLARGGRVPAAAARAGRVLGVHPLFAFRDGRAHPLGPARSAGQARRRLAAAAPTGRPQVAALHAGDRQGAEALLAAVRRRADPALAFVADFSPVMVAHTGPGLLGLAWLRPRPAPESCAGAPSA